MMNPFDNEHDVCEYCFKRVDLDRCECALCAVCGEKLPLNSDGYCDVCAQTHAGCEDCGLPTKRTELVDLGADASGEHLRCESCHAAAQPKPEPFWTSCGHCGHLTNICKCHRKVA